MQGAVLVRGDIAAAFQGAHGPADAGLGVAQIFTHIYGAHAGAFHGEDVDALQIHLPGLVQIHGNIPP